MDPMPFLSSNQQYQDTEGNSKPNPNWPHSWPHPFSLSTTGLVREGEWSLYASCLMPVPWQCIAHRQLTTMWYNKITCTKTKSIASQLGMASTKHAHMLIYGPIRIHTITNSVKFCEQCICRCVFVAVIGEHCRHHPSSVRSVPSLLQFCRDLKTALFQSLYSSP